MQGSWSLNHPNQCITTSPRNRTALIFSNSTPISDVTSEPASPNVQECVAKCDWSVECAPGVRSARNPGNRLLHSYDEMTEWHLSNSDLANDNWYVTLATNASIFCSIELIRDGLIGLICLIKSILMNSKFFCSYNDHPKS